MKAIASAFLLAATLSGCSPSIWTLSTKDDVPDDLDGAVLSYALSRGEVTFTADYAKNVLTLSSDQKVIAQPDFNHRYVLAYNHTALSSDEISIQFDGAVLKKISSTTADKSIEAITAINAILTQTGAVQDTFRKAHDMKSLAAQPADDKPPPCAEMKAASVLDVTYNRAAKTLQQQPAAGCSIEITASVGKPSAIMGVIGFPGGKAELQNTTNPCNRSVCFRLGASFDVTAQAFVKRGTATEAKTEPLTFTVLAPAHDALGFVKFNRRAFVENKTSITFTNGIVSDFSATNPSEVLGFLKLPSEILRGVAIAVPIYH